MRSAVLHSSAQPLDKPMGIQALMQQYLVVHCENCNLRVTCNPQRVEQQL